MEQHGQLHPFRQAQAGGTTPLLAPLGQQALFPLGLKGLAKIIDQAKHFR